MEPPSNGNGIYYKFPSTITDRLLHTNQISLKTQENEHGEIGPVLQYGGGEDVDHLPYTTRLLVRDDCCDSNATILYADVQLMTPDGVIQNDTQDFCTLDLQTGETLYQIRKPWDGDAGEFTIYKRINETQSKYWGSCDQQRSRFANVSAKYCACHELGATVVQFDAKATADERAIGLAIALLHHIVFGGIVRPVNTQQQQQQQQQQNQYPQQQQQLPQQHEQYQLQQQQQPQFYPRCYLEQYSPSEGSQCSQCERERYQ